jgi:hypothetical protein
LSRARLSPGRVFAVAILVLLGTLAAFGASLTIWTDRQLLDTGAWTRSSRALLADPSIRGVIAHEIVRRLQSQASQLAVVDPTAAATLENVSESDVGDYLASPRAQAIWEQTNRSTHSALVSVLEGKSTEGPVSASQGEVVLDLGPLLEGATRSLGLGALLEQGQIPNSRIVLANPGELDSARRAVRTTRLIGIWLGIAAFLCYALAVGIARGRRGGALAACGTGLALAGVGLIVLRRVVGDAVVNSYVQTLSYRPAIRSAWLIETRPLSTIALWLVAIGAAAVVAGVVTELVGSSRSPRGSAPVHVTGSPPAT